MSALVDPTEWPIFILSLEGDENRRAPLLSALSDMGFAPQVLIGVDGRGGLPECQERRVLRTRKNPLMRPLTDGELACALSHVNAYNKILDEDLPGAIIFEDDARINEKFKAFVDADGHKAGDMVLLGHGRCRTRWRRERQVGPGMELYRIVMMPRLAHAYSVSLSAAQILISAATPVTEEADWPCDISKMHVLAVDPQLACQNNEDIEHSHLEADRLEEKARDKVVRPLNRRKRKLLKRLKSSWWADRFAMRFNRKLS